jgi:cyclophilin family peptidyl-prolyl cis-trans isomerase
MQPRKHESMKRKIPNRFVWCFRAFVAICAVWLSSTVGGQSAPKQAVVETSLGTFVVDLMPEAAPNQVAYFIKTAQAGGYDGTTFHAMFKNGMVQGGDPLSKDPAKRSAYGTGGQNAVKAEARAPSIAAGAVAAVLVPSLANQLTVFGKVADGMEVLQKISETPLDASRHAIDRIGITRVTIRDTPPEPFVNETAQQLSAHRAVLDTSAGAITIEFLADKAPETVRQFLRLVNAGVYNGMAFHRVAPGFVIQTGALSSRVAPLSARQQGLVRNLPPEFNDTKHVKGTVSMARGDAPDSATSVHGVWAGRRRHGRRRGD